MSRGVEINTWEAFKDFSGSYALPIYYVEYDNKYDCSVHTAEGVRYYYIVVKDNQAEVDELLAMEQEPPV